MRSVIDEIAVAEQQAEEIRLTAAAEAREMTQKAREDAKSALAALEQAQRDEARAQMERARKQGETLSKEMLSKLEQEADAVCARAQAKLPEAIAYLLNKVTKTA